MAKQKTYPVNTEGEEQLPPLTIRGLDTRRVTKKPSVIRDENWVVRPVREPGLQLPSRKEIDR